MWKRFLMGAALITVAAGSATGIAAYHEVDRVVEALKRGGKLNLGDELAEAEPGKPQTIMLVGSDKRARTARDFEGAGRSDTVILVRLDPSKEATALMSLPRDLKVEIPGHGTDKLNAAFSEGGAKLTLRTVKQFTGLSVNHVINVDFGGFREAVDELGCVYMDIDRRYFNDNSGAEQYATIDIQQGYQRLCGQDSLDFVRYRHEDNDIVRAGRQQDFLRQAKAQVGVGDLFEDRDELYEIFTDYTKSDLRSRDQILNLLRLIVQSARHPVREVHFSGRIGPTYVTASDERVQKLVDEFLGVEQSKGPRGELRAGDDESGGSGSSRRRRSSSRTRLEDASAAGRDQALQAVANGLRGMPVFYPRQRTSGAVFVGAPRVYRIRDDDGDLHRAYRMVLARAQSGYREYYGVQGMTWKDPPILDDPSEKREIGNREYELHYDGDRLRLVAWRNDKGVYWVANTLLHTLSEREMLAIARSARSL